MPGNFTVTITDIQKVARADDGNLTTVKVSVRVQGYDNYKGDVGMTYTHDNPNPPPPDSIIPTSESLHIPKNSFVDTFFNVTLDGEVTVEAEGVDSSTTPPLTAYDRALISS